MKHSIVIYDAPNGAPKKVSVDGLLFPAMNQMRWHYGISESLILSFRKQGYSKEESIDLALCHKEAYLSKRQQVFERQRAEWQQQKEQREAKAFLFRNRSFKNFPACCRYYENKFEISLNPNSIKVSAKAKGEAVADALERVIQRKLHDRFSHKKPKYLYVFFNTKEKAERCKQQLGFRHVSFETDFNYGGCYEVRYKPL